MISFVKDYFLSQIAELSKAEKHVMDSENVVNEDGQSSESVSNICNSGSAGPPMDDDSSDTYLKLG